MKELSEMKKRVLLAKQRLKMGYWNKIEQNRNRLNDENHSFEVVRKIVVEQTKRDERLILERDRAVEEENLYLKVCKILDENPDEIAPIGRLIDRAVYEKLDEQGKQRYVLSLAEKFRKLSERYYLEKSASTIV